MSDRSKHPETKVLMQAAKTGVVNFSEHLDGCEQCQEQFSLFQQLAGVKIGEPEPAPETGVYRHAAIARLEMTRHPSRKEIGVVAFDSWSERPTEAVRDLGSTLERRLRFVADQFLVEVVSS